MSLKAMSAVWERVDLDPYERLVMLCLADHADDDGECFPSNPRICQRTGMKERGVQSVMKRLVEKGIISIDLNKGRKGANLYRIAPAPDAGVPPHVMPPASDAPPHEMPPHPVRPPASDAPRPRTGCGGTPAPDAGEPSYNDQEPSEEKIPPYSPAEEFERIWPHYPKRVEKADARKAWLTARRTHSFEEIAVPLREYIRLRKGEDQQFTISLGRWLKRERWTDEVQHGANRARSSTEDLRGLATVSAADDLARLWGPTERKAIGQ